MLCAAVIVVVFRSLDTHYKIYISTFADSNIEDKIRGKHLASCGKTQRTIGTHTHGHVHTHTIGTKKENEHESNGNQIYCWFIYRFLKRNSKSSKCVLSKVPYDIKQPYQEKRGLFLHLFYGSHTTHHSLSLSLAISEYFVIFILMRHTLTLCSIYFRCV